MSIERGLTVNMNRKKVKLFKYYVVELADMLELGEAELEIDWQGDLTGTLVGINKVTYKDQGFLSNIILFLD